MKNAKELVDLPVINITEGNQLGTIRDLIIDPNELSVEFLIVGQDDWQVSMQALHYENVVGVGDYAVIVEGEQPFTELSDIPLLNKKRNLNGPQVITIGGEFAGRIVDYYFNEENGKLESLLINSTNQELLFPIENVLSLGKEFIIINGSLSELIPNIQDNEQQAVPSKRGEGPNNIKKEALKVMLSEFMKKDLTNPISPKSEDE